MIRTLLLTHRYVGIATCLLFAMWFGSGVVLMYVGFPQLTAVERFKGLTPLDLCAAHVLPSQTLAVAGIDGWPRELRPRWCSAGKLTSCNPGKGPGTRCLLTMALSCMGSSRPVLSLRHNTSPASRVCASSA